MSATSLGGAELGHYRAAGAAPRLIIDVRGRLALVVLLNVAVAAGVMHVGSPYWPQFPGFSLPTLRWGFLLGQSASLAILLALSLPLGWRSVLEALLAAVLLAYAYVLCDESYADPRQSLDAAFLVGRAVVLGIASASVFAFGLSLRLFAHRRLHCARRAIDPSSRSFCVRDLMFLVATIAVGLGIANLFLPESGRAGPCLDAAIALAGVLPAVLPWLWLATRARPSGRDFVLVLGITVALAACKYAAMFAMAAPDPPGLLRQHVVLITIGYTLAAALNGLAVRGLGFRSQSR